MEQGKKANSSKLTTNIAGELFKWNEARKQIAVCRDSRAYQGSGCMHAAAWPEDHTSAQQIRLQTPEDGPGSFPQSHSPHPVSNLEKPKYHNDQTNTQTHNTTNNNLRHIVRSFVLCGQEPSLLWTPARRPSAGPVRMPLGERRDLVGVCSVWATCRRGRLSRHEQLVRYLLMRPVKAWLAE